MAKGYLDVEHEAVMDVILVGHCDLGSVADDLVSGHLGFKTWAKSEVADRSGPYDASSAVCCTDPKSSTHVTPVGHLP